MIISKHSHIGGTRWVHLWLELRYLLNLELDLKFSLENHKETMNQFTPEEDFQQFLYHTSHNLKGPLSRLKGLIDLILLEKDHKRSNQYVGKIDDEVKQMEKMLAKLQSMSDALSVEHESVECKVDYLLNTLLSKHQKAIQDKNIFVRINAPKDLTFRTFVPLLRLILDNLLENAIQYSKSDVAQSNLTITLIKPGHSLNISIEDNGEGIRKEVNEKIFEIFYRDSLKSDGGGLGLYIVREALKKLKGSINLQSEEGDYTRFLLTIPEQIPVKEKSYHSASKKNHNV